MRDSIAAGLIRAWIVAAMVCVPLLVAGQTQSTTGPVQQPDTTAQISSATPSPSGQDLLAEAKSETEHGSLEKANDAAHRYLGLHPDSADGHFLLGLILFKQGKAPESLAEYTTGAKYHDPGSADLKTVALDYVLLADYVSADHWLTRSLQGNQKDPQAWYYLGRAKYNENRFQEALDAFQQCLKLDPRNVKAEDNRGLTLQPLGRTDEAREAFRNAIAWQSHLLNKNSGPFINMGILLLEQDQIEEAVPFLTEAAEISPDDSRAHEQLSKIYLRQNQLQKAQNELEKAVALEPDRASLHFMLGQLYRKRGMNDKAKSELDRGAALRDSSRPAVMMPEHP